MALINLHTIRMAYGGPPLLDGANLHIESGERIGLLGRNGEGKTTLLRIITGAIEPDDGHVARERGARIAYLEQAIPHTLEGTVYDVVAEQWDHEHGLDHPVEKTLSLLGLDPAQPVATLSGGMKRRVLLARALVGEPDLLILDEPTNHLDIDSIQWLESFLLRWPGALLFVSHDRIFLRQLATRIVELDRGRLTSWACDYPTYLQRREALLDAEEQQWAAFDKKLVEEEKWIRQGIKARRTRNEGRVRALESMRRERAQRRERTGTVQLQWNAADPSGEKVIMATDISHSYGDSPCVTGFSGTIQRGQRIGIIGPNGCGKTTLINILLGFLPPQGGHVRHGTRLAIAYFDQHRIEISDQHSVKYNLCGDDDFIQTSEGRQHAIGYLRRFLFSAQDALQPAGALSGGERNRLMLAKLFARPSNVLVLDEPTNDLDMETLDLLEECIATYPGTVLLVSHDRALLNNVVTDIWAFEGDSRITPYVGGYDDWVRQRPDPTSSNPADTDTRPPDRTGGTRKLSNKERAELRTLPGTIEALESELHTLQERLNDPAFYRESPDTIKGVTERVEAIPALLDTHYERWAELDRT